MKLGEKARLAWEREQVNERERQENEREYLREKRKWVEASFRQELEHFLKGSEGHEIEIQSITSYGDSYNVTSSGESRIPAEVFFSVDGIKMVARDQLGTPPWRFFYLSPLVDEIRQPHGRHVKNLAALGGALEE